MKMTRQTARKILCKEGLDKQGIKVSNNNFKIFSILILKLTKIDKQIKSIQISLIIIINSKISPFIKFKDLSIKMAIKVKTLFKGIISQIIYSFNLILTN